MSPQVGLKKLFQVFLLTSVSQLVLSPALTRAHAQDAPNQSAQTQEGGVQDVVIHGQSANKAAATRLHKIAGATAVIDSAAVEKHGVASVADLLAYQPGVIAQSGGDGTLKLSIRGSGINNGDMAGAFRTGVLYLFDGLAITGPSGTPNDLFEPIGLQRTEIQLGANAFDLGSLSLGGSVNFIPKTGYDSSPLEVRVEAGSYGTAKAAISTGGVSGNLDYHVGLTAGRSDGYMANSGDRNIGLEANVGYKISSNVDTRFYLLMRNDDPEMPGYVTLQGLNDDPKIGSNYGYKARNLAKSIWAANKTTFHLDDGSTLTFGLVYYYHPYNAYYYGGVSYPQPRFQDLNASIRYQRDDKIFGHDSTTTLGVLSSESLNAVGEKAVDSTGNTFYESRFNGNQNNFFITNDTALTQALHLVTGLAVIRTWREGQILLPQRSNNFELTSWAVAPRLGVLYSFNPAIQLFSNISRSIEPPIAPFVPGSNTSDVFTSGEAAGFQSVTGGLRNQNAYTFEIGGRGDAPILGIWSLDLYRSWIRDELLESQLSETVNGTTYTTAQMLNASPTLHQGIEAGLETTLWQDPTKGNVALKQSYTYSDFHYVNDPTFGKNTLPGVPAHFYQAELSYNAPSGFFVAVNTQVASKSYLDYANTEAAPAYAILGANFGFTVPGTKVNLFADFRNLTNAHYAESVTPVFDLKTSPAATISPGYGFNFLTGVSWSY